MEGAAAGPQAPNFQLPGDSTMVMPIETQARNDRTKALRTLVVGVPSPGNDATDEPPRNAADIRGILAIGVGPDSPPGY